MRRCFVLTPVHRLVFFCLLHVVICKSCVLIFVRLLQSTTPNHSPVQENLRWKCDRDVADRICNFNRHYAEHSGYFKTVSEFLSEADGTPEGSEITFYDSNTGKPLFIAPRNRTMEEFLKESRAHGWPSFRDGRFVGWSKVSLCLLRQLISMF